MNAGGGGCGLWGICGNYFDMTNSEWEFVLKIGSGLRIFRWLFPMALPDALAAATALSDQDAIRPNTGYKMHHRSNVFHLQNSFNSFNSFNSQ